MHPSEPLVPDDPSGIDLRAPLVYAAAGAAGAINGYLLEMARQAVMLVREVAATAPADNKGRRLSMRAAADDGIRVELHVDLETGSFSATVARRAGRRSKE